MKTIIITILFIALAFGLHAQTKEVEIKKVTVSHNPQNDTINTSGAITYEMTVEILKPIIATSVNQKAIIKKLQLIKPVFSDLKKDFIYQHLYVDIAIGERDPLRHNTQTISGGYYQVYYKPKKSGFFKIPAIAFEFEGKKYSTKARNVIVRKAADDGRFTLGAGEKRIMYGFPIPLSTSHFVVKINDKFASNSVSVQPSQHLTTDSRATIGNGKAKYTEMKYYFERCTIKQKIIPVAADLKMATESKPPQYYRIEYEIENHEGTSKTLALNLLIDIMIGGNDAAQVGLADKDSIIDTESVLLGSQIPERLWVHEQTGDKGKMIAELRNVAQDTTQSPQAIYIGKWSEFYRTLWEVNFKPEKYKDSGMMVRWDNRTLPPLSKITFAVYYGLPDFKMKKEGSLSFLFDEPETVESVEDVIYYGDNSPEITATQRQKIDKMLKKVPLANILGISIEGFSDAKGDTEENFRLSQQRAESVANYLNKKGIAKYRLMPKGYGEVYARPTTNSLKAAEDRKVVLRIVYKAK